MRVDEVALREFLHTSYPRLVAAVALVCGSRAAAEDAVQEALLRAWERSEKGDEIRSLEGWVTTVALNLARSGLRRIRSERAARARLHTSGVGEPPTAERSSEPGSRRIRVACTRTSSGARNGDTSRVGPNPAPSR